MGERLNFTAAGVTPKQQRDGCTVVDPMVGPRRIFRAFRIIEQPGKTGLLPVGEGNEYLTRLRAIQQCEADLDDVLRDRAPAVDSRPMYGPDPATTDDTQELMDRVIRRAQYLALRAVLAELDRQHVLAKPHPWAVQWVRGMVNDAARALGTAEPYRVAP